MEYMELKFSLDNLFYLKQMFQLFYSSLYQCNAKVTESTIVSSQPYIWLADLYGMR